MNLHVEYRIQYSNQSSSGAVFACICIHSVPPGPRGGYEYKDLMKLQAAGYKPHVEKWDSDSDSDETDKEDLKA